MFDLNLVPKRYFEFKVPGSGKVLHIQPPKLKTLKKWEDIEEDGSVAELANVVASIISKNRDNFKITGDTVLEWMDQDQLTAFMSAYAKWLKREKDTNPN